MRKILLLLLAAAFMAGCTGSGAVNPLTPSKSIEPDHSTLAAESEVIYWSPLPVTFTLTDPLNGVVMLNKKLGWACGNNGLLLKYDGETWSRVTIPYAQNENLNALSFSNENEGWVV